MPYALPGNAGFFGHVGESAVAIVVVERVAQRLGRIVKIALATVDEVDVHPAVVVVVEKARSLRRPFPADTSPASAHWNAPNESRSPKEESLQRWAWSEPPRGASESAATRSALRRPRLRPLPSFSRTNAASSPSDFCLVRGALNEPLISRAGFAAKPLLR